jgi:hypothetical protein
VLLAWEIEAGLAAGPLESPPPQEISVAPKAAIIDGATTRRAILTKLEGI